MAKRKQQDLTQFFRIRMLGSWDRKLRSMDMPGGYVRVANSARCTECAMIVRTEGEGGAKLCVEDVSRDMRHVLDFEGWMHVEEVPVVEGKRIQDQAVEDGHYVAALEKSLKSNKQA